MKIQIRKGVFETNSSSVHSLTMCMDDEYQKWKDGLIVYDKWEEQFRPLDQKDDDCYSFDEYWESIDNETFHETFKTPNGEKIHAFGYYGYDC